MNHALVGAVLGLSLAATGQTHATEAFKIDPSHVHVAFEISHLGLSTTIGQFGGIAGTLTLDENEPANSAVDVTIDAASVDTNWEARDEHLRSPDFFNVAQFPTITFKSTKVETTGDSSAKIHGDLTLLGVTKPVVLDARLNQIGPHPLRPEQRVAGFSATTAIKRSDFGMNAYVPAVGDDVTIQIEVEASPAS